MTDDLNAPLLGKKKKPFAVRLRRKWPGKGEWPIARIAFGLTVLIIAVATLRIALVDDPASGRPIAVVEISSSQNANSTASETAAPPAFFQQPNVSPPAGVITEIEGGPAITNVDAALADANVSQPATNPLSRLGIDADLVEETQNGPIPHIGPNGKTPFNTYARASIGPATANGRPLIAIVVTGLGLSESSTLDAIAKLPDNVTLAFAPYGRSLQRTTAAARAEGHEMLLQVPLEPFDYPDNDPGPQTLLTSQPPRANLDKLFWIMARFGGYYGLMNHMGARFTSAAADFEPIMEELGTRGLAYLDDGSSNRSLAPQLAGSNNVPFARANIELDTNPSRSGILSALQALEANATTNGSAIGIASALPISIQTIAEWANNLETRGFTLVPVSALMTTP